MKKHHSLTDLPPDLTVEAQNGMLKALVWRIERIAVDVKMGRVGFLDAIEIIEQALELGGYRATIPDARIQRAVAYAFLGDIGKPAEMPALPDKTNGKDSKP